MAASIRVGPLQRAADYFNLLSILRSEIRKVLKFFYLASRLAEPSLLGDASPIAERNSAMKCRGL